MGTAMWHDSTFPLSHALHVYAYAYVRWIPRLDMLILPSNIRFQHLLVPNHHHFSLDR